MKPTERKTVEEFANELRELLDSEGMDRVDDAEISNEGYQMILATLRAYGEQVREEECAKGVEYFIEHRRVSREEFLARFPELAPQVVARTETKGEL